MNISDNLQTLSDRLVGPFDIEAVVDPIGVKISDAIMNFQNSGYDVTRRVFNDCGRPRNEKRKRKRRQTGRHQYGYAYGGGHSQVQSGSSSADANSDFDSKLKSLIKEIKAEVGDAVGFWTRLPYEMCENDNVGTGRKRRQQSECWNGHDKGEYVNGVVHDGLAHQEANPEVAVDVSRPDIDINEQIFALKLMTKRMESAYNGQTVEWPSNAHDDHHGRQAGHSHDYDQHGSGDCDQYSDDEDCYDYYDDGSGSGDGDDVEDDQSAEDDDVREDGDSDEEEANWPPWMTTNKPKKNGLNDDEEIRIEDVSNSIENENDSRMDENSSSSTFSSASSFTNVRRVLNLALPMLACYLGSSLLAL